MRKFFQGETPECLSGRWENWGLDWQRRRNDNARAQFYWPVLDGTALNQLLMPFLKRQTQDHCSFCDNFPVCPPSIDTVEHFRPKSLFPRAAYHWQNLYYCCMFCQQQKREQFHEDLLQPDALDYEFDRYFRGDFTLGRIEINERAPARDQECARKTILLYGLNKGDHTRVRRLAAHRRAQARSDPIDDFAYRDFVDPPRPSI